MGSRRAVVLLIVLGLALAGCGGGDDDKGSGDPIEQDKQAESDARKLVLLVETCFVDQQDYSRCFDPPATEDVGQATVESSAPGEFVVVSPSESGNEFRIEKGASSTLQRTCEEPGSGDCPANGRW